MLCIQVPINEISCPLKKSWKFRWRNARNVVVRRGRSGWGSAFWSGEFEEGTFVLMMLVLVPVMQLELPG